ncbi:MAG: undecaprenyl-phosphate glucose phosphotransferase, partial [Gammaproteobacteria bacterium]
MLADPQTQRQFFEPRAAPAAQVMALIDPLVTIGVLLLAMALFRVPFDGPYLILALVVFSLTFPGRSPGASTVGALAGEVVIGWVTTVALLLFIGWATGTMEIFDPRVLSAWLIATPVARFATHLGVPKLLLRLLAAEGAQRVAVIAGACGLGRTLTEQIRRQPLLGVRIAGFFDDRGPERTMEAARGIGPILGTIDELPSYAKSHRVDLIYITLPMASQPRIVRLLDQLHDTTASIYFVPDIFLFDLIQARIDTIGGIPVAAVCETPFHGLDGVVKRASDIVLALLILLLISPLLLAIAIGVKLSSPGPVLFRQRRYGLDGREIQVYKFRSMRVTEDGEVIRQATRDDERVTRFGAFLRRYSL